MKYKLILIVVLIPLIAHANSYKKGVGAKHTSVFGKDETIYFDNCSVDKESVFDKHAILVYTEDPHLFAARWTSPIVSGSRKIVIIIICRFFYGILDKEISDLQLKKIGHEFLNRKKASLLRTSYAYAWADPSTVFQSQGKTKNLKVKVKVDVFDYTYLWETDNYNADTRFVSGKYASGQPVLERRYAFKNKFITVYCQQVAVEKYRTNKRSLYLCEDALRNIAIK